MCKKSILKPQELADSGELCNYCEWTEEFGEGRMVFSTPNGPSMCEGRFCEQAYENYLDEKYLESEGK